VPFNPTPGVPVNPTDINQIGVQVLPLAAPPAADSGIEAGTVTPGTVELIIDDVSLQ
jgi:hypothetical protein